MACPYFYPVARLDNREWTVAPRWPLGDAYRGECRAGEEPFQPDEKLERETCNVGYGRGCCGNFPDESDADAARFHITGDSGAALSVQYIFEKGWWPLRHGVMEYSSATKSFTDAPPDLILGRQASAFAESYLRRRDS
jgi:hypothetical protein